MSGNLYLLLNLLTLAGPFVRSFEPRVAFRTRWGALLPTIGVVGLLFVAWDVVFTHLGVWGFHGRYLVGWWVLGLPIEEWLFFFTVPYACVFLYDCLNYFFPLRVQPAWARWAALCVAIGSATLAVHYSDRLYTLTACLLTSACMAYAWFTNPKYLAQFVRAYALSLVPFGLVNSVLTGALTELPIVWYDDRENAAVRLGTIPFEDSLYWLSLLWLNVSQYEWRQHRRKLKPKARTTH